MADAAVVGESLTKRFGAKPPTVAMAGIDFEIAEGEFLVLLGSSGCGKTTTLRCLAGLETADTGRIQLGNEVVFDAEQRVNLPPNRRNIGMVFQSFALWPHMTVAQNIGFPLRARKVRDVDHAARVRETAELVDCGHLLERYPAQLSGGQQQRVAVARGLAARPDLVLLDEPLSNLDARLRDIVRGQLHELHERLRFTAVFVTHDQGEALALADRIAIMREGSLVQVGTSEEVFQSPQTDYVAEFVGFANALPLARDGRAWTVAGQPASGAFSVPRSQAKTTIRVRPDDLALSPADTRPDGSLSVRGEVIDAQFGGRYSDVTLRVGDVKLVSRAASSALASWPTPARRGVPVTVSVADEAALIYDEAGALVDPNTALERATLDSAS